MDNVVEVSVPLVGTVVTLCLEHDLRIVESDRGGEEFIITFSGESNDRPLIDIG